MQIVPHLFFPLGTGNQSAEMITIQPVNENADHQCFCYVFDVPSDHPQGTYFWHTHRHGTALTQAYQGMFGYMIVGTDSNPGSAAAQLAAQGITRTEPLAIWEWAVGANSTVVGEPDTYMEGSFFGQFFGSQVTTYLTNNEYQPTFNACVDETIHFRLLCAQADAGSAIYVLDSSDNPVPFFVFASDGITYTKAYNKTMIAVGQAMREALLMQFPKAGKYRIMQGIIPAFPGAAAQFAPQHIAAFIVVADQGCTGDGTDLSALTFTPGMPHAIADVNISSTITVTFEAVRERNEAPVPRFDINNEIYATNQISRIVAPGYVLMR